MIYDLERADLATYAPCETLVGDTDVSLSIVLAAGDLNGDGRDDLVLSGRSGAGRALIVFGRSPLASIVDLAIDYDVAIAGADTPDSFAGSPFNTSVADLNCDGIADLIVGARTADGPSNSRSDCGEAYVFFGRSSWPRQIDLAVDSPDILIYGPDNGDQLGVEIATGDVNGDGCADVAFGFNGWGPSNNRRGAGEIRIVYGNTILPPLIDFRFTSGSVVIHGADVNDNAYRMAIGRFDADSVDDLVVGAQVGDGPGNARTDCGEVYIFKGGSLSAFTDLATTRPDLTIYGVDPDDRLNRAALGDFDGDGRGDLAMTAILGDGPGNLWTDTGEVHILKSRALPSPTIDLNVTKADWIVYGVDVSDYSGEQSITLADVNNDGKADLLVGVAAGDGPGNTRVDGGELHILLGGIGTGERWLRSAAADVTVYGAAAPTISGDQLANCRILVTDMDGNGSKEVVVSAPYAKHPLFPTRQLPGVTYVLCQSDLFGGSQTWLYRNSRITTTSPPTPPLALIFPLGTSDRYDLVAFVPHVIAGDVAGTNPRDPGSHPLVFYQLEANGTLLALKAGADVRLRW